ncbi:tol-pal system-associated acyl-CoA thioesterase [Paenalcaligenes niemegkensis]|uniref:tol-pal system-associated acyl-CoA thioesterase n=1 Tax=Paenalcaligenes niemegkensis TaxID=2895469 RepID=UPI001EE82E43|nr:tol-pal system-associated acyl-CoA thioesterase [Paenalcaligenes niemegkensis]MCQ9615310.1 tol-pal system-associated acyl-CoA thioesterase [Paenalcaligenes niemegkensis]
MPVENTSTASELYIRVYYEDTDAGGIVFYANYLKFFERARTEWLRSLGISQSEMATTTGQVFVVKDVEIQYRKPAGLDDLLCIRSTITHIGAASVTFHQTATLAEELLCTSSIQVVCVDASTLRPAKFNHELRLSLEKAQD